MAKKEKINHHSKCSIDNANDHTWYERYKSMNSWKDNELNEAFITKFCVELMEWADKEDSQYLEDFLCDKGIPEKTFYDWCKRYTAITHSHDYTMNRLASRKQRKLESFNPQNIAFTLASYSKRWAACEEYKAKLKARNPEAANLDLETFISELQVLMEEKYANKSGNQRKDETVCAKTLPVENHRSD